MKILGHITSVLATAILLQMPISISLAQSEELVVASYLPEGLFNSKAVKHFGELVSERTNGEVTFKYYFDGSLAGPKEIVPMTTSGAIDIGFISAEYYPANFPLTTLFSIPMLSNHMDATQRAVNVLFEENPAFGEEFDRLNFKRLLILVADISPLGSNKRVESLDDVKGMRIRSSGVFAQLIDAWGGTPIALGSAEIYQSMQSGLLDGFTAQPLQDFRAKSLDTVTDYAIDVGFGIYHTGYFVINKDTFESLSPEVQTIMQEAAFEANSKSNEINMENTRAAIPLTIENGLELYSVSDSAKQQMREVGLPAMTEAWVKQAAGSGVEERTARDLLARFKELTAEYDQNPMSMNYWEIYQQ